MKAIILLIGITLTTLSCSSQIYLDPVSLNSAIEKREFYFNASEAFPTSGDLVGIMNSIPNASATRITKLDPGYGFQLKKDSLSVYLPYFGRAYRADYASANSGALRFESTNFSLDESKSKKGNIIFIIKPKDHKANMIFNLEIFKNGAAFLSVNSDDRQPISYDGNISIRN